MVATDAIKGHEWEVQVELALLADPLTFPYAIKTQFASAGLVLRGYVPNPTVKERAVTLARGIIPLEVVDRMVVHAAVTMPPPGQTFAVEEARRLRRVHADLGNNLDVTKTTDGRITLAGMASSLDEKLEFSRCLRGASRMPFGPKRGHCSARDGTDHRPGDV